MSENRPKETSLFPMLLGVSLLGIGLVATGAYFFSRYVTRWMAMNAPRVEKGHNAVQVERNFRWAMYPTARRVHDADARIAVDLPSSGSYLVATSEYVTHDEIDEIAAFYTKWYGSPVEERGEKGALRWTHKEGTATGIVSVKTIDGYPHIRLVWIDQDQDSDQGDVP